MSSSGQCVSRRRARWSWGLSVLGLLVGVLGMHGLAPGGGVPGHSRPTHMTHATDTPTYTTTYTTHMTRSTHTTAVTALGAQAPDGCAGDGHCDGGHVRHADSACASGAVSGGPELPALVPDPVPVAGCGDAARTYAAEAPDGARAPPSLAELQLLRI